MAKHGFDFADAELVFTGARFTYEDDRFVYGEQRLITMGLLDQVLVAISHTATDDEMYHFNVKRY